MDDDTRGDLAHLLALQRGPTGADLLPVAHRIAATPRGVRLRRALARAGRGEHLGLHLVPGLVLVDLLEHGDGGRHQLAPGCVVAHVYGGDPDAAFELPPDHAPAGVVVIVVWHPARPWHRIRAWWRERTWKP